jgi:hypothetical protein
VLVARNVTCLYVFCIVFQPEDDPRRSKLVALINTINLVVLKILIYIFTFVISKLPLRVTGIRNMPLVSELKCHHLKPYLLAQTATCHYSHTYTCTYCDVLRENGDDYVLRNSWLS